MTLTAALPLAVIAVAVLLPLAREYIAFRRECAPRPVAGHGVHALPVARARTRGHGAARRKARAPVARDRRGHDPGLLARGCGSQARPGACAAAIALSASSTEPAPSRSTTGSGPVRSSTVDAVPGSSPASTS